MGLNPGYLLKSFLLYPKRSLSENPSVCFWFDKQCHNLVCITNSTHKKNSNGRLHKTSIVVDPPDSPPARKIRQRTASDDAKKKDREARSIAIEKGGFQLEFVSISYKSHDLWKFLVENLFKASPKGFSASKCDVGNWTRIPRAEGYYYCAWYSFFRNGRYFQNLRNLFRNCLEIFGEFFKVIFWEKIFWRISWEDFFGRIF